MLRKNSIYLVLTVFISAQTTAQEIEGQDGVFTCPDKPADENEANELAGHFFSRGEQLFKEGRFQDALQQFLCSLEIKEHDNTLFNIAHVASRVEDITAVHRLLTDYLADAPEGDTTDELKKMLEEVEAMSGLGTPVEEKKVPEVKIEEPPPPAEPVVVNEDKGKKKRVLRTMGWISLGTGGASLITAAVLQGLAVSAKSDALDATTYDQFKSEKDKKESLQIGATVGFIAGGVLGGAGLAMLLLGADDESDGSATVSLVPAPDGLMLRGYF